MADLWRRTIDRSALPAALLPEIKTHCRVEFNRDDAYLTRAAGRAIDLFERLTEWGVFERHFTWSITAAEGAAHNGGWRWLLPIAPVTAIKADANGDDVSSQYKVVTASPDMVAQAWMVRDLGEPDPMPVIDLQTGYKTLEELPPSILDFIFRASAWLYENREANLMPGAYMMAYANSLMAGQWLPKA
jgi:hypothetical protein